MDMKLYLTVILIYISLMSNEDEHFFMCLCTFFKKNEFLVSLISSK